VQLLEYKWIILFIVEVFAWVSTFMMFYLRYFLRNRLFFKISAIFAVLTGIIPQLYLMIANIIKTREIGFFEVVVTCLVIYGFTIGKRHIKRIDNWIQEKSKRGKLP
jgi:hypothetical protein